MLVVCAIAPPMGEGMEEQCDGGIATAVDPDTAPCVARRPCPPHRSRRLHHGTFPLIMSLILSHGVLSRSRRSRGVAPICIRPTGHTGFGTAHSAATACLVSLRLVCCPITTEARVARTRIRPTGCVNLAHVLHLHRARVRTRIDGLVQQRLCGHKTVGHDAGS
jgi:hypothetical protein